MLIVDDDRDLSALLTEYLAGVGISSVVATDGARGLALALEGNFDLVILDVMMPLLDGFEVLRQLRKRSNVPVIMLTTRRDREDRIAGLQNGADDYLPKPFDPDELLARVQAVMRRSSRPKPSAAETILVGSLSIEVHNRLARCNHLVLDLTSIEFEILDLLARPAGRVVSRDEISGAIYQRQAQAYDRSLDVHVSRLRQKLAQSKVGIRSIRGVGYILTEAGGELS